MDTNSDTTTIDHLFAPEAPANAQAPAEPAPLPPAVEGTQQTPSAVMTPPAPVVPDQPAVPAPRMVPLPELEKTRRRAQAAEAQVAQLAEAVQRLTAPAQPAHQQPDPLTDPEGAFQVLHQEIVELKNQQQVQARNAHLNLSEAQARIKYGQDVVDKAFDAVQQAGYAEAFINRADPYGELVAWYQGQAARAEIGDPAAYKAKVAAEVRAQILAEMKAGTPVPQNLAPSLASATRANSAPSVVPDGGDFFKSMFVKRTP